MWIWKFSLRIRAAAFCTLCNLTICQSSKQHQRWKTFYACSCPIMADLDVDDGAWSVVTTPVTIMKIMMMIKMMTMKMKIMITNILLMMMMEMTKTTILIMLMMIMKTTTLTIMMQLMKMAMLMIMMSLIIMMMMRMVMIGGGLVAVTKVVMMFMSNGNHYPSEIYSSLYFLNVAKTG